MKSNEKSKSKNKNNSNRYMMNQSANFDHEMSNSSPANFLSKTFDE